MEFFLGFKDLFADVRDIVGGRSKAVQETMRDAIRVALLCVKIRLYLREMIYKSVKLSEERKVLMCMYYMVVKKRIVCSYHIKIIPFLILD